jgi:AraC family ethanolamine operon transcriptional activator
MDIVTSRCAGDLGVTVPMSLVRETAAALFRRTGVNEQGAARVCQAGLQPLDDLRGAILGALGERRNDAEALSAFIARCLALIESPNAADERFVANDARGKVVARALDMIEHRFDRPLRLHDLCSHAGVGIRLLQRAFQERLGLSPMQYLKARRLSAARRLLSEAHPREKRVSEIARQCGFAHLGRFSVDYRSHFGETPSRTLRSSCH